MKVKPSHEIQAVGWFIEYQDRQVMERRGYGEEQSYIMLPEVVSTNGGGPLQHIAQDATGCTDSVK